MFNKARDQSIHDNLKSRAADTHNYFTLKRTFLTVYCMKMLTLLLLYYCDLIGL